MRTGNFVSLSERDYAAIRERRAFEREEAEKQRVAEDKEQHQQYVADLAQEQQRVPRAFKVEPLDFETWRTYTDQNESDPVLRGAAATNRALLRRVNEDAEKDNEVARKAIREGKPDPAWKLPKSAHGLNMTIEAAKKFAEAEGERFASETPEYEKYRSDGTAKLINHYLMAQPDLQIPDANCFRAVFERLKSLNMLTANPEPEPAPEPEPEPQPEPEAPSSEQVGWDPNTGQQRTYTQREIDRMGSEEFRRVFRLCGDRKPQFTRSRFQ